MWRGFNQPIRMSVMIESKILFMVNTQYTLSDWLVETRHIQTWSESKFPRSCNHSHGKMPLD